MKAYNYHCIRCNHLIASNNNPIEVPILCFDCEKKDTREALTRQNQSINFDVEKLKRIKQKRKYKKCHN